MPQVPVEQQIAIAKQKMAQEMPQESAGASVGPMGSFGQAMAGLKGRMTGGTPAATTDIFTGNVAYNPSALQGQSQDEIDQTLAHELTHTKQIQSQPWYQRGFNALKAALPMTPWQYPALPGQIAPKDYQPDPDELEAYQTEHDRALAKQIPQSGDVWLPKPRPPQQPIAGLKGALSGPR